MRLSRQSPVLARGLSVALLALAAAAPARHSLSAQVRPPTPQPSPYPRAIMYDGEDTTRRSGPRFGLVYLGGTIPDTARARAGKSVSRAVSLFGWEFQYQLGRNPGGPQPVTALSFGVGGLDQGVLLPTVSGIIGIRMPNDLEFGVGPNVSGAGPALVLTAGVTRHMGTINVPIDLAVVPSSIGTRISVTTGFNVTR